MADQTASERRAERENATKSGGYHLDLSQEAALRVGEAKEWAEADKTAEAVREARAACEEAVNSRQAARDAQRLADTTAERQLDGPRMHRDDNRSAAHVAVNGRFG